VPETPAVFETNSAFTSPGLPRNCCAAGSGMSTAAPSVPTPSEVTIALTVAVAARPPESTWRMSPGVASSLSAAFRLRYTSFA
jgi:hypothetical protein